MNEILMFVLFPTLLFGVFIFVTLVYLLLPIRQKLGNALADGFMRSRYIFTRGQYSGDTDFYFDVDLNSTNPKLLDTITNWYIDKIEQLKSESENVDKLAFIEKDSGPVGAILLAGHIISKTKIPGIIIRLRKRIPITSMKGSYPIQKGDSIILISDVATSGGGIKKAIKKLEGFDVKVLAAIVLINRGGQVLEENLKKEGIDLFYALSVSSAEDLRKKLDEDLFIRESRSKIPLTI